MHPESTRHSSDRSSTAPASSTSAPRPPSATIAWNGQRLCSVSAFSSQGVLGSYGACALDENTRGSREARRSSILFLSTSGHRRASYTIRFQRLGNAARNLPFHGPKASRKNRVLSQLESTDGSRAYS